MCFQQQSSVLRGKYLTSIDYVLRKWKKEKRRKQNKNISFFGQLLYIYNVSHPIV